MAFLHENIYIIKQYFMSFSDFNSLFLELSASALTARSQMRKACDWEQTSQTTSSLIRAVHYMCSITAHIVYTIVYMYMQEMIYLMHLIQTGLNRDKTMNIFQVCFNFFWHTRRSNIRIIVKTTFLVLCTKICTLYIYYLHSESQNWFSQFSDLLRAVFECDSEYSNLHARTYIIYIQIPFIHI